jgi:hypothetical protein
MDRQIPGGWTFGLALAALALPLVALGLSVRVLAESHWERMGRDCRERAAQLRGREARRPALRGASIPGNAVQDYLHAQKLLKKDYAVNQAMERPEDTDRETLQALLDPLLPALQLLRQGAARSEARPETSWEENQNQTCNLWRFVGPGICWSRFLAEAGRPREAAEVLLDLMQAANDCSRLAGWWEASSDVWQQSRCLTELKSLTGSGALDREDLRKIARELQVLESALPTFGEGMLNDTMMRGFRVLRTKTSEALLEEYGVHDKKLSAWRQGFSDKLMMVKSYEIALRAAERMAEGDARSWSEARAATRDACLGIMSSGNPIATMEWWDSRSKLDLVPIQSVFRAGLARFRMLRAALEYRTEGLVPELDDPFGGKLRWSKSGRLLKIWSVGPDGIDGGGAGDWDTKGSPDIVLQLGR